MPDLSNPETRKPPLNLVIRIERATKQPLICWDASRYGTAISKIGVYFTNERYHEEICPEWYYAETYKCRDSQLCNTLFKSYTENWEGESIPRLRQKLK